MYIGPWQEFKLARILHLKDKVEREEEEENRLSTDQAIQSKSRLPSDSGTGQRFQKAYSVGTGMMERENGS